MSAVNIILALLARADRREDGATAVEYALVVGLVSLVVVGAVAAFSGKIDTFVSSVKFS